jgi:hypothetical protein
MTADDERARRLDAENRDEFAIRHEEASLEAQQRTLEREMAQFEDAEAEAKRAIEAEWRSEHHGHDPERTPAWRSAGSPPAGTTPPGDG